MLVLLVGCLGLPPEVPNTPAVLTETNAPEAMSVASPDLPYLIYATLQQLQVEDFRTCPAYSGTSASVTYTGDCSDSAYVSWEGEATSSVSGYSTSISVDNFGVSGLAGGWKASGTIDVEAARGSASVFITSALTIVQLDAPAKVYWVDTAGSYTSDEDSQILYADEYSGTVGIQDVGLVKVDTLRTAVAIANECDFAAAGTGTSQLSGKNVEDLEFHPDSAVDGGTADTGGDTGTATTTVSACGCPTVSLDSVQVYTCAAAKRAFTYPFFPLGE